MKIDIHVHTKKTKSGDAPTRDIDPKRFGDIIRATDVGIIAVTNHNDFDFEQYTKLALVVESICQVWPGVEFDVVDSGSRSHLLVIVSPKVASAFDIQMKSVRAKISADNFAISLDDIVKIFDDLDPIYVAHYYSKKPALSDKAVMYLTNLVKQPMHIIKEATDSLSVGIFISHGHRAIYGSDIHDWNDYIKEATNLPELRLPVDSFEQFGLLLSKDESTINTILNKKHQETITIKPFPEDKPITLTVFNDINVFFGSKGTGKSDILQAICKYYNDQGQKCRVYEASADHVNQRFDIKGEAFDVELKNFGIDECRKEFAFIYKAEECLVTSISKYTSYYSNIITNSRAKRLKAQNFLQDDSEGPLRRFDDINKTLVKFNEFIHFLSRNKEITTYIDIKIKTKTLNALNEITKKLTEAAEKKFIEGKTAELFNSFIDFLSNTVSMKTGKPRKPTGTGFLEHARNRIKIEKALRMIVSNLQKPIELLPEMIGDLGEKGEIFCKTEAVFQTGGITDSNLKPVGDIKKNEQKRLSKSLMTLVEKVYTDDLFEILSEALQDEDIHKVDSIKEFILFKRHFIVNGKPYTPSSGESSMLLLHKELSEEKEIYLLDEPEKSLGNDYINDVIVPMLKELVRNGKKIFIATHDANIAVRTLPYNSIHRRHGIDGYKTYIGNPFTNYLSCIDEPGLKIDWKETSMKTLEGGRDAFGEREKIYGKV